MGKTKRNVPKELTEHQLERELEREERRLRRIKYNAPAPKQRDHFHEETHGSRSDQDRDAISENIKENDTLAEESARFLDELEEAAADDEWVGEFDKEVMRDWARAYHERE